MEHPWKSKVSIPAKEMNAIEHFVEDVSKAVHEPLRSIALYGSAAKNDYCEATSDINIVLAFNSISLETLDALAPCLQRARRSFRLSVLLVSDEDLQRSTDVFPIKFLDIQTHHILLWGEDVLSMIQIESEHLRLRCEQECKNISMRLRKMYLERLQRPEKIERTLVQLFSSFSIALDTLLFLKQGSYAVLKSKIIEQSQSLLGSHVESLHSLYALKQGKLDADPEALKSLYASFMQVVADAALLADSME